MQQDYTHITLPQWLDDYIFNTLQACYCRRNSDMLAINFTEKEIREYLGTYFPRSYAESYSIFSRYFLQYHSDYQQLSTLNIFDFGCGTGGEIIGLIDAVNTQLPNIEILNIKGYDGNQIALRKLENIIAQNPKNLQVTFTPIPHKIDDFYDLSIVKQVCLTPNDKYDIILTFKAICEFVTKQQFEQQNPYLHIINTFIDNLTDKGIMCISDITTKNQVSNEWLPLMLDNAIHEAKVNTLMKNNNFNEMFYTFHSHMPYGDGSKLAWRIINKQ